MSEPRILVVEDERVVAEDIEQCLRKLGYQVVGAASYGTQALRAAVHKQPDLVLMDIKLRGSVDGIDAAQELYHRLHIPVVYLTAHADGKILERAKLTAPAGYVLKPFDERALGTAIEIALYRHQRERKLLDNERQFATALRSIDEGVIVTRANGEITLVNRTAEALTGCKKNEALGKHFNEVFATVHAETGASLKSPLGRAAHEGAAVGLGDRTVLVGRDGRETHIQGTTAPIRDDNGRLVGFATVFRNSPPDGLDAAKAEANPDSVSLLLLSRLAAGVASDLNGLLAKIQDHGETIAKRLASCQAAGSELPALLRAAKEASELASHLLAYIRPHRARPRVVAVTELVASLEVLLRYAAGEEVEFNMDLRPDTGVIKAEPAHIEQLLLRLVGFFRRHDSAGSKLMLETARVDLDGQVSGLKPGPHALVTLSHTGGLSEHSGSEKELAVIDALVAQACGQVRFYNEPGKISSFQIYLPALRLV